MTCKEIVKSLRHCECSASLSKGISTLEDGTCFDLAGAVWAHLIFACCFVQSAQPCLNPRIFFRI